MTRAMEWRNWSGAVTASPRALLRPQSEDELKAAVAEAAAAGRDLRVVGSGHSFVPLCASDDVLLSLDRLQGIVAIDQDLRRAEAWAGSKLYQLGRPLWAAGLSFENLGDIDRQSVAGAIATGTHGTGRALRSLSNQVVSITLVTASGDLLVVERRREPQLFRAAALSLGVLGVASRVTLQLLPAYELEERTWSEPFEECMEAVEERIRDHRHFELFFYPHRDRCWCKSLQPTASALPASGGTLPGVERRVGSSYRIFPSIRAQKFNEIEYAIPADRGPECLRELRSLMQERFSEVRWPLEYRTLAGDELLLSPAQGRDSVTISAHQGAELPYRELFREIEAVFRSYDGRPHWGKWHTLQAEELSRLYDGWEAFQEERRRLDPQGVFLNPYLRRALGE